MIRGFPPCEFEARVARAQSEMTKAGLAALLLTTEPEFRYFTGFLTRFWESPSRPWFLIVPASGRPVAVVPSIGAALLGQSWIDDIRTWAAPDPQDDGVTLLADALREQGGPVGVPSGPESGLRMPLADFARVQNLSGLEFRDDAGITARLRAIKSDAEIAEISAACDVAARAFDRMDEIAGADVPLDRIFRAFQGLLL